MPPHTGVKVEMGGELRTLRYNTLSLIKLESVRKEPLTATIQSASRVSTKAIADLLWAGLLHTNPRIRQEDVIEWMDSPVMDLLSKAMEALQPWISAPKVEDEGAEGNPEPVAD